MARKKEPEKQVFLLGVGLDNKDGHKRITHGDDDIVVVGGSEETHEQMQDVIIRFTESLHNRGKRLQDASTEEVVDLLHDAMED